MSDLEYWLGLNDAAGEDQEEEEEEKEENY